MSGFPEYSRYDAIGLAELVRRGDVDAAELVEEAISRIERLEPRLNALVHRLDQAARAAAKTNLPDGPFTGVPFLVKDLLQTIAGVPTLHGSRFHVGSVPTRDSELIRRYRAAGLVLLGKTGTPELGMLPVTEPELTGPVRNPWDPSRTPGGSSGGSAAVVAAGIVPMAHAGDGGGSIRIPASCCGLFGLKPTRARTPIGPDVSEHWNGFSIDHVVSRSVRDSALVLDATCGPEPTSLYYAPPRERPFIEEVGRLPGRLRIAFHAEPAMPSTVHPECVAAVEEVARLVQSLGHDVEEVRPGHEAAALGRAFFTIGCAQVGADIEEAGRRLERAPTPREWEKETWITRMLARQLTSIDYVTAVRVLQAEARRLAMFYEGYDVVLTPTLASPPLPTGALRARGIEAGFQAIVARTSFDLALRLSAAVDRAVERVFDFTPFTPVANFTGQPSMSVPLVWNDEGLPIGVLFTGRLGDEPTLLRLAAQLEQARPWSDRRPSIHADGGPIRRGAFGGASP